MGGGKNPPPTMYIMYINCYKPFKYRFTIKLVLASQSLSAGSSQKALSHHVYHALAADELKHAITRDHQADMNTAEVDKADDAILYKSIQCV
jgi:hypothetical protein